MEILSKSDENYQTQENRTIVVYNLDQSLGFKELAEDFSRFGSVMRMQLPLEYSSPVLPRTSELLELLKNSN